jgi:hypothetical protein
MFIFSITSILTWGPPSPLRMDTGGCFPGGKATEREADYPPASSTEVKDGGAISPLRIRLHSMVLN